MAKSTNKHNRRKNSIFIDNITDFFQTPTTNILSFKLTYYLDYLDFIKTNKNDKINNLYKSFENKPVLIDVI